MNGNEYLVLLRTRPSDQGGIVVDLGLWRALLGSLKSLECLKFQESMVRVLFPGFLAYNGS